ncbi:MAG: ImmA/IrrE family metallo-endopeptidase [Candidatus Aminicenantaceae bacterium]
MDSDISEGCTKDHHFGSAILINENNAPWRRHFDIAHELFHLITWELFTEEEIHHDKIEGERRVEQLADVFASSLLLPEKEVRDEFEKRIDEESITYLDLVHMARDFVVPLEALLLRMINIGLLDKEKIQKGMDNGSVKDIDKKYRHSQWSETAKPHISERYISLAIKAFFLGKITKEKLAEYVDESYSAIPSFLRNYGYDENEDYSIEYRTP